MSRLDAIRQRLAAATPGLWEEERSQWQPHYLPADEAMYDCLATLDTDGDCGCGASVTARVADADLIVHAPEDLAFLLAELDRVSAELASVRQPAAELVCDCCGQPRYALPFHHDAHDDSGQSWDYCTDCNGCELTSCQLR